MLQHYLMWGSNSLLPRLIFHRKEPTGYKAKRELEVNSNLNHAHERIFSTDSYRQNIFVKTYLSNTYLSKHICQNSCPEYLFYIQQNHASFRYTQKRTIATHIINVMLRITSSDIQDLQLIMPRTFMSRKICIFTFLNSFLDCMYCKTRK